MGHGRQLLQRPRGHGDPRGGHGRDLYLVPLLLFTACASSLTFLAQGSIRRSSSTSPACSGAPLLDSAALVHPAPPGVMKTGGRSSSAGTPSFYGALPTTQVSGAGMRECGNQSKMGGNGDALEGGVGIFNSGGMGSSSLPSLAEIIRHFRATGSSSYTDIFDFILFFGVRLFHSKRVRRQRARS